MSAMSSTTSSLLTLPLRISTAIYSRLQTARTQSVLLYQNQPTKPQSNLPFNYSIILVSKQIYYEAVPVLYSQPQNIQIRTVRSQAQCFTSDLGPFALEIRRNVSADSMFYIAWPTSHWKSGTLLTGATKMQRSPSMPLETTACVAARVEWQSARGRGWKVVVSEERKR